MSTIWTLQMWRSRGTKDGLAPKDMSPKMWPQMLDCWVIINHHPGTIQGPSGTQDCMCLKPSLPNRPKPSAFKCNLLNSWQSLHSIWHLWVCYCCRSKQRLRDPGGGMQEEMKSELKIEGRQEWANGTSSMTKGKSTGQHKWDNISYNLFSGKKGQLPD